jgi:hypothetical protein
MAPIGASCVAAVVWFIAPLTAQRTFDLVITGGRIIDGSGAMLRLKETPSRPSGDLISRRLRVPLMPQFPVTVLSNRQRPPCTYSRYTFAFPRFLRIESPRISIR